VKTVPQSDESPLDLALANDLEIPDDWRVEYFDGDGTCYVAIFVGQEAESRARDYYGAIRDGRLATRSSRVIRSHL
jgi:hypothetical protein